MMEVHPLAALFPMMTDDELQDLAADIKEHGLLHPIVLDADGVLIDGRNRLRACEIAEVEPTFKNLNGHDAAAFIVSANLSRRNLSKGQQAMALAMIYPEPKRGIHSQLKLSTQGPDKGLLSKARAILRHSRALAEDVLADRVKFDAALRTIENERQASASIDAQMAELRAKAPDVAALVADERLTIEAGLAELAQRQRQVRQCLDNGREAVARFVGLGGYLTVIKTAAALTDADLMMAGLDRDDAVLFEGLTERELGSLAAAHDELRKLKRRDG